MAHSLPPDQAARSAVHKDAPKPTPAHVPPARHSKAYDARARSVAKPPKPPRPAPSTSTTEPTPAPVSAESTPTPSTPAPVSADELVPRDPARAEPGSAAPAPSEIAGVEAAPEPALANDPAEDCRPKPSMVPNAFGRPDPRTEPCPARSAPCDTPSTEHPTTDDSFGNDTSGDHQSGDDHSGDGDSGTDSPAHNIPAHNISGKDISGNSRSGDDRSGDDLTDDQRGPSPLDVISHAPDWRLRTTPQKPRRHLPRSDEFSAGGLAIRYFDARPSAAIIGRIDRRGRLLWSLPKGHIEAGETAADAAVREVEEETGIIGTVVAPLGIIDYWFVAEGRRVHKTVTHFLMEAIGGELSDEDPEVVAVAWVPLDDLPRRLAYADERRIAVDAIRLMADSA